MSKNHEALFTPPKKLDRQHEDHQVAFAKLLEAVRSAYTDVLSVQDKEPSEVFVQRTTVAFNKPRSGPYHMAEWNAVEDPNAFLINRGNKLQIRVPIDPPQRLPHEPYVTIESQLESGSLWLNGNSRGLPPGAARRRPWLQVLVSVDQRTTAYSIGPYETRHNPDFDTDGRFFSVPRQLDLSQLTEHILYYEPIVAATIPSEPKIPNIFADDQS